MSSITRSTMFDPLLQADPTFQPSWEAFLSDWGPESDALLYLALSSLAKHMGALLAAGEASSLDRAFEVVERWHVEGDAYVREAATIGLLESLQRVGSRSDFEKWMRPETMRWWRKLDAFWRGDAEALRSDT